MDIKRVENFFELLNDTDIKELCWEKEGLKLRIKRSIHQPLATEPEVDFEIVNAGEAQEQAEVDVFDQEVVKSGFVGSFCLTNGKKKIDVKIGDRLQNNQVVGYVEAMNIFKEIVTEFAGVVKEVKVKENDPIEYGQELFVIDIK